MQDCLAAVLAATSAETPERPASLVRNKGLGPLAAVRSIYGDRRRVYLLLFNDATEIIIVVETTAMYDGPLLRL